MLRVRIHVKLYFFQPERSKNAGGHFILKVLFVFRKVLVNGRHQTGDIKPEGQKGFGDLVGGRAPDAGLGFLNDRLFSDDLVRFKAANARFKQMGCPEIAGQDEDKDPGGRSQHPRLPPQGGFGRLRVLIDRNLRGRLIFWSLR